MGHGGSLEGWGARAELALSNGTCAGAGTARCVGCVQSLCFAPHRQVSPALRCRARATPPTRRTSGPARTRCSHPSSGGTCLCRPSCTASAAGTQRRAWTGANSTSQPRSATPPRLAARAGNRARTEAGWRAPAPAAPWARPWARPTGPSPSSPSPLRSRRSSRGRPATSRRPPPQCLVSAVAPRPQAASTQCGGAPMSGCSGRAWMTGRWGCCCC